MGFRAGNTCDDCPCYNKDTVPYILKLSCKTYTLKPRSPCELREMRPEIGARLLSSLHLGLGRLPFIPNTGY